MSESRLREHLRERTKAAAVRLADAAAPGESVHPGDLFAMPETAEFPIEWVVVAEDGSPPRRVLQLPADTNPVLGPNDVRIPEGASGGPLVLRCGFGVWTDPRRARVELRTGSIDAIYVDRARRGWESATLNPDADADSLPADPDYEDWVEDVLGPATAALESTNRPPRSTDSAGATPSGLSGARLRRYALAASVFLAFGFLAGLHYERSLSDAGMESVEEIQRRLDALETERTSAQAEHRAELEALERELERSDRTRRGEVAALERRVAQAPRPEPLINAPFAWLTPLERTRGRTVEPLSVSPDAEWIFVVLEVRDPTDYAEYQLEIRDGGGETVWSHRDLIKSGSVELPLVLPSASFPPGEYQFALLGVVADSTTPVARYELRVARAPR